MKTPTIQHPVQYKHCIIAPVTDPRTQGFDVFDSKGRWFHVKTQKQAKWWASIESSIEDRKMQNPVRALPTTNTDPSNP